MASMQELLLNLQSADKGTRTHAEAVYNSMLQEQRDQTVGNLLQVLTNPAADLVAARGLACVLLRQAFDATNAAQVPQPSVIVFAKQALLSAMSSEPEASIRRKLLHCIGQVSAFLPSGEPWPEVLQLTSQLIQDAQNHSSREVGFRLLDRLAEYNAELLTAVLPQILGALRQGLTDEKVTEVRVAALKAACSIVVELRDSGELGSFRDLTPGMVSALSDALNGEEEEAAREALGALGLVTDEMPKFWKDSLDYLGPLLTLIVKSGNLEASTRVRALDLLCSLSERCPTRLRRSPWVAQDLLPTLLSILCVPPAGDLQAWGARADCPDSFADLEDADDEEGDEAADARELAEAGAMAVDRIATSLGGKCVFPVLAPMLVQALQNQEEWGVRRGALLTLALLAEGCRAELAQQLPQLLPFISTQLCNDPHPRVVHAMLTCLGQLADDLCEEMNNGPLAQAHVLPVLVQALGDNNAAYPRIQGTAAAALVSLCQPDKCRASALGPHLPNLLERLFRLLGAAPMAVKEEAMTAVATIAQVVEEGFAPYYNAFIPLAKSALAEAAAPRAVGKEEEHEGGSVLGMKALEAFALMGHAVGKDLFRADAHEVLRVVAPWHRAEDATSSGDSVQAASYVMMSTARIAGALGVEFAPYLDTVLPPVLQAAAMTPDYSVRSVDGEEEGSGPSEDHEGIQTIGVNIRGRGDMELRINTWQMQHRDIACRALLTYVQEMGDALGQWVGPVLTVALGLCQTKVPGETRSCGYAMLPRLLRAMCRLAARGQIAGNLPHESLSQALATLMTSLHDETRLMDAGQEESAQYLGIAADTLSDVIKVAAESKEKLGYAPVDVPSDAISPLFLLLQKLMLGSIQRRLQLQASADDEDAAPDEFTLQDRVEWEQDIVASIQHSVGSAFRSASGSPDAAQVPVVVEAFRSVLWPMLGPMLQPANSIELQVLGLCLALDALEFGGPGMHDAAAAVLPTLTQLLQSDDMEARQTAAYGVGVLAMVGGPAALGTGEVVKHVIQLAMLKSEHAALVRDNAVSSVLRLCRHCASSCSFFDASRLLPVALGWLPLRHDLQEAHSCHRHLIQWLGSDEAPTLVGEGGANVPRLVHILAELMSDARDEESRSSPLQGDDADEEGDMWDEQLVGKETRMALEELLQRLKTQWPAEAWQKGLEGLSLEDRSWLDVSTAAFLEKVRGRA